MLKHSYDIVIWGDSLCAVLTAAGLSARGLDVLFLTDMEVSGKTSPLSYEISHLPVGGIPESDLTAKILGQAGINLYDGSLFQPCRPLLQFVAGRERIDITSDIAENAKEICLGASGKPGRIADVLADGVRGREKAVEFLRGGIDIFPPHNLRKKLSYSLRRRGGKTPIPQKNFYEEARGLKGGDLLAQLSLLLAKLSIPAMPDNSGGHLIPLPLCGRSSFSPRKGMKGFKGLVLEQLKKKGVDVLGVSGIERLEFVKNRAAAVRFDKKVVSAKAFLFGGHVGDLAALLPDSFSGRAMKKRLSAHKPSGMWQSVFISLEEGLMPVGMHDELILEACDGEPLLIQKICYTCGTDVPDGQHLLKVSRPVPFAEESGKCAESSDRSASEDGGSSNSFEGLAIEELKRLIPFMDGRFKVLYSSDGRTGSADDYFYSGDFKPPFNIGSLSPMSVFPNLFIASKELIPILGIEGDFVAAELLAGYLVEAASPPEK